MEAAQPEPSALKEWSLGVLLEWRPEVRFYDLRAAILERLEKEGLRRAYRVENDTVRAILTSDFHELVATERTAVVRAATRDAEPEQAVKALSVVVDELRPSAITGVNVVLQHVVPLEGEYDPTRKTAAANLFAASLATELRATDFAVLVDGEWLPGQLSKPSDYHAEFGIVARAEVGDRLTRWVGRMGSDIGPMPFGTSGWNEDEYPAVGLFVDSSWWVRARIDASEVPDRAAASIEDVRRSAREMVESLIRRVGSASEK